MRDLATLVEDLESVLRAPLPRAERCRRAADAIRRAGGFHWVGLYDVTATEIAAAAWTGAEAPAFPRFPRDRGLNGAAVACEEWVGLLRAPAATRIALTNRSRTGELSSDLHTAHVPMSMAGSRTGR